VFLDEKANPEKWGELHMVIVIYIYVENSMVYGNIIVYMLLGPRGPTWPYMMLARGNAVSPG